MAKTRSLIELTRTIFTRVSKTGSSKTNAPVIILCQEFTADGVYHVSE